MRLSAEKIEAIKQNAGHVIGSRENVRLLDSRTKGQRGFTLVELIVIIIIVGIISVAAVPRFFDNNVFDSRGFYDQVISTLRFAQKTAVAQRRFVCVTFTANSISLAYGTNSDCTVGAGALVSPSGAPYPLASPQASFNPVPANFSFDCLGRPRSMALATGICGNTLAVLAANQTVQVSNVDAITIWQETGYVR